MATRTSELKAAWVSYCKRHGLRSSRDYEIGCATLRRSKGRYVVEIGIASNTGIAGIVGWEYPAGVRGLESAAMTLWLRSH